MKRTYFYLFLLITMMMGTASAGEPIPVNYCMSGLICRKSVEQLKNELYDQAAQKAGDLLAEELEKAMDAHGSSSFPEGVSPSSTGWYKIDTEAAYWNGDEFGQVCVTVYVTVSDEVRRHLPIKITGKDCVSGKNLTKQQLIRSTKEKAVIFALLDHEKKLSGYEKTLLMRLIHDVRCIDMENDDAADAHCASFEGLIYPSEIQALIGDHPLPRASDALAQTAAPRKTPASESRTAEEKTVPSPPPQPVKSPEILQEPSSLAGKYPEASIRPLTDQEIADKSAWELRIMRNEIFARHGYKFKTKALREYFNKQPWYKGLYHNVSSKLSDIEEMNVKHILQYEG